MQVNYSLKNGNEYRGEFKLCMPVRATPDTGTVGIYATTSAAQYNLYLANNTNAKQQSYIIADPAYTDLTAVAALKWNKVVSPYGRLIVNKIDGSGRPLAGAIFKHRGVEPRAPCGVYFPVCGVKEPLGIRQYSEEPFPCLRKNIHPHGPKEFKASKIFFRRGKKRRKADAFRAFLTKHKGNFAALNRRGVRLPCAIIINIIYRHRREHHGENQAFNRQRQ